MSNFIYDYARSAFASGLIAWDDSTLTVYCLDAGYTGDRAVDQFVSDLPGASILGTPTNLSGATVLDAGVLDAADVSYPGVTFGQTVERIVIAQNTGVDATSKLIIYLDTYDDTTPISRAGDGSNIPIVWPDDDTRIAKL